MSNKRGRVITTPAELRAVLLQTAIGVIEGRINVAQANAVVGCSAEVHKSVKQEWDMRSYAADGLPEQMGRVIDVLLEGPEDVR